MILLILWQTSKHMADGGVPQMVVTLGLEHVWQGFRYMVRLEDRALQKLKALGLWGIGAILFIKPFPHDDALHKPSIMLLKAPIINLQNSSWMFSSLHVKAKSSQTVWNNLVQFKILSKKINTSYVDKSPQMKNMQSQDCSQNISVVHVSKIKKIMMYMYMSGNSGYLDKNICLCL